MHAYLKAKGHFFKGGELLQSVFVTTAGTKSADWFGEGTLVIGYVEEELFIGARLMQALSQGYKAETAAHLCLPGLNRLDNFWNSYLTVGRYAIDSKHEVPFVADHYILESKMLRTCRWCGARHQRVLTPRTVFDESGVPAEALD